MSTMQKLVFTAILLLDEVAASSWRPTTTARQRQLEQSTSTTPLVISCFGGPNSITVTTLNSVSGTELWSTEVRSINRNPCLFSRDGSNIVCLQMANSSTGAIVEVRNAESGALERSQKVPRSCANGFLAGLHSDGSVLLLCTQDPANLTTSTAMMLNLTTGSRKWTFNVSRQELGPVYDEGDVIYIGSDTGDMSPPSALNGFLHAVQWSNGQTFWTYHTESPVVGLVRSEQSSLLVSTMDGKLRAVNASTGAELWRVQAIIPAHPEKFYPHNIFAPLGEPALGKKQSVVYVFTVGGIKAFSTVDGKPLWSDAAALGGGDGCSIDRPLISNLGSERIYSFANDSMTPRPYPAGPDPDLLVTNAANHSHPWRTHPGFEGPCPSLFWSSYDASTIYVTVEFGTFFMHALHASNGTKKWTFGCPSQDSAPFVV